MNNDLILWACGLAAVLFHTLLKGQSMLKDAQVANINFNFWKDYIVKDALSIFLALNSVWIWYLVYNEFFGYYPNYSGLVRVSFVMWGLCGSYIVQLIASRTKKALRNRVDRMTGSGPKKDL